MIVRPATRHDVRSIVRAAALFAVEAYQGDPCNEAHVAEVVERAIDGEDALAAVLETDEAVFAGCYLGCTGRNPLTGLREFVEIFLWVEPWSRGHGRKLVTYAEEWARWKGCHSAALSHPETSERVGKVFKAWGYSPSERWLRKVL